MYLLQILPLNLVANRTVYSFIRTFCADRKYQRTLRIGRFLTPNEADDFWAVRNDRASEYNASLLANCKRAQPVVGEANLTNAQTVLAALPKIIDAV